MLNDRACFHRPSISCVRNPSTDARLIAADDTDARRPPTALLFLIPPRLSREGRPFSRFTAARGSCVVRNMVLWNTYIHKTTSVLVYFIAAQTVGVWREGAVGELGRAKSWCEINDADLDPLNEWSSSKYRWVVTSLRRHTRVVVRRSSDAHGRRTLSDHR
jgi:hypothetical protein